MSSTHLSEVHEVLGEAQVALRNSDSGEIHLSSIKQKVWCRIDVGGAYDQKLLEFPMSMRVQRLKAEP